MAKTVNVNSVFSSILNSLDTLKGELDSLRGKYDTGISTIGGVSVNFGTWSDNVSTRFQSYYTDTIMAGVNSIDGDIGGGGFNSLITTTDSLIASISTCNTLQTDIKVTKKEMQTTPKTVRVKTGTKKVANNPDWRPSYQGGSNTDTGFHYEDVYETQANPDYTALEEALAQFEEDLEAEVTTANGLFATLAGISFSGTVGGGTGGGAGAPTTEGTPSTPTGQTPKTGEPAGDTPDAVAEQTPEADGNASGIPEGAQRFGKDQNFYASTQTIGDGSNSMTVDVYYDADTGSRVYIDPATGSVAICYQHDDGSIRTMFTTTSNRNLFSNKNDGQGGAETIFEVMRGCKDTAAESSVGATTEMVDSQLSVHVFDNSSKFGLQYDPGESFSDVDGDLAKFQGNWGKHI